MFEQRDVDAQGNFFDAPSARVKPSGGLVVALGSSAGGLEALRSFFNAMPYDIGFSFILVQHLDPQHPSLLPQLLGAHTAMRVEEAADGQPLAENRVYVAPSNATVTVHNNHLRLTRPIDQRAQRTVIDTLFRSLAEDRRERAAAVVLSGSGQDSALGLRAVKENGGLTIAQAPSTARHPDMAKHAIATGLIDYVLAVEEMPAALIDYARRLAAPGARAAIGHDEILERLPEVCAVVHECTGHDFSQYKRTTLLRRLQRRAQVRQAPSIDAYVDLLRRDQDEPMQLVRDLLIGVTEFFRDAEMFDVLRHQVVPALFENRRADGQIRVWVPGCATGEEVYSIALLLAEHLATMSTPPRVQIFGTDLDERALEVARQARYSSSIAEYVSADRLSRFFVIDGDSLCVGKAVRELCIFSRHDLIKDPPFSRLDLISCRNVLIYLEGDLQKRVLGIFHYALADGGYLVLGPSENVTGRSDLFRTVDGKRRIFQKKRVVGHALARLLVGERSWTERRSGELLRSGAWMPERSVEQVIERRLLERYGPACVVVNEQGDIVYLSGPTGKYLAPSTGALDVNVASMVMRALRPEVRSAVHRAVRTREQVIHENVAVETTGGTQRINLVVRPLGDVDDDLGLFVVLFDEVGPPTRVQPSTPASPRDDTGLVNQLEHELKATREHLQTTIEELETSNEELKSSNEELLSMNEELHSLNAEFESLNGELKTKLDELDTANNDLQNLLLSTQIPTVFLDEELRIKRFTPAATEVFRLIDSDVGRPIIDIAARFDAASLVVDARDVLRTLAPKQREVRLEDGQCCYIMRALPYRTLSNVISGVVITFVNVTALKDAAEQRTRLAAIVESSEEAIIGKRLDGTITSWNAAAERMYGYHAGEVIGRSISVIVPPDRLDELREDMYKMRRGDTVERHETVRLARDGRRIEVSLKVSPIRDADGNHVGASVAAYDVTPRKRAEEALRASEEEFRVLFENAGVGTALCEAETTRLLRVNRKLAAMLGFDAASLAGKTFDEISEPEDAARDREPYQRLVRGENAEFWSERRLVTKSGRHLWVHATFTATRSRDGRAARTVAVVHDLTQRKQVEADLITARETAEHASRAKDQFMAVLSHELRTPLTPIVTAASQLLRRDDLVDDVRRSVSMIQRNAELEARLIDDLLDLTRISRGKLDLRRQTVTARAVLQHAIEICSDEIDAKGVRVVLDVAAGEHWITVDAARLQQVLWNLLKNAVKFSMRGSQVNVRCVDEGRDVIIEVRDSGVGIEPDLIPRIFNAFEQGSAASSRHFGGLGLGLTISQAIVQLHRGTLTAESAGRGAGATFRVRLPMADAPGPEAYAGASEAAPPSRSLHILLVEDHEDTAVMMSELLLLSGHVVRVAGSVRAAVELAEAHTFDLLVSDLGLPDGSGLDVLAALRGIGRDMRSIALSGYGMEEDRRKTADAGFLEHLVKPVSFRDLEAAIHRVTALPR